MKLLISTKFFPLLVITLLFTSKVCSADEFNDLVDSIFASIDDANAPGCSVGVVENGRLIHKAGYGLANLELGVELDGNNVHRMGSVYPLPLEEGPGVRALPRQVEFRPFGPG
jgi:hypothetical protein